MTDKANALSVFVIALGLVVAAALDGSPRQLISRDVPAPDLVERGRQAFIISCAGCHAVDARGDSGPDLVRSEMMLNDEGGDLLGPLLRAGREDQGMPAFQLSDIAVAELAGFIRAQSQAVINRGLYEIQNVATGDAGRGRAYFDGEGGCSGCHSPTGDLAGIGRRFEPPDLLRRFVYPGGGRGRALPTRLVVTLEGGQVLEGTLDYIDDFNLAFRDDAGEYHSVSPSEVDVEIRNPYGAHIELLGRYTDQDLHDLITYLVTLR